jgi:hypothetical protein
VKAEKIKIQAEFEALAAVVLKSTVFLGYNDVYSFEMEQMFRRNLSTPFSKTKINPSKDRT